MALAAGIFGLWQNHFADLQHYRDQQAALDQQRAGILQTYIGNMQSLLFTYKLTTSAPGSEKRQLALVETLTTLRRLDARRNDILLRFLREAGLIAGPEPIINLSDTDLSNANLSRADLSGINLTNTDLSHAILNNANLSGAALFGANLTDANLTDANLSEASLTSAILTGAHMNHALLTNATLTSAALSDVHLDDASLTTATLRGADLSGADLRGANLNGTDLGSADLIGTQLDGADLSEANLTAISLTQPELNTVQSCTNAVLNPGFRCNHNTSINLTYWYTESPAEVPVIHRLIGQFEQQNPKIRINPINVNYFQAETAFERASGEREAPDVLRSDVNWIAQFAAQGYLENIDSFLPQSDLSDYLSAPLSYDYFDGHLYGLPQVTDFLALLYNRAELKRAGVDSPPRTMTDFKNDAIKIVQRKSAKYGFETDGTAYNALPFLYAFGGRMLNRHGDILINRSGSVAGLEFLLALENKYKVMPRNVYYGNGGPVTPIVTDFMYGKTAMIFGGPYNIPEILAGSSFERDPKNLGIARIPACPAGTRTCRAGKTGTPSGGQSYVISADTKHPFDAYKFISFMSSTPSQIEIAEANHTLPTRKSAYKKTVSSQQFSSEFLPLLPTVVAQPGIPQAGHLFDAFDPQIADVLDRHESPLAALTAVADAWKQLLAGS